ncbi:hypothetical protein QA601_00425 [Chitinispirillales bacterium ANBcel5]|uniref:tetratricopeptide repeat protein n=1 Tax=Cellulosispirillum alkaliphilum TaxID=3039283 RepID=UPI002A56B42C|nr:hypothetical protein [Chitinispirillales bacterium ANBcel5]
MFTQKYAKELKELSADTQNKTLLTNLSSAYWSYLADTCGSLLRDKKDLDQFLSDESDLINFGLCSELIEAEKVSDEISDGLNGNRIPVYDISSWLKELVSKIKDGDKKEQLERDLHLGEIRKKKLEAELKDIQSQRCAILEQHLKKNSREWKRQIEALENTDKLLGVSIKSKKAIARGKFLSVESKREHCVREKQLSSELEKRDSLFGSMPDQETVFTLKKQAKSIEEIFITIADLEYAIEKMSAELIDLEKKSDQMSPLEMENRVKREIEYLRDMAKLSAKRLHLDTVALLKSGDKYLTGKMLGEYVNRILEFDPHIFHNDRVNIFGKPSILVVPGCGNSLYDWKNNRIIIPLTAPSGNFMASVACAIIEYRLDVDEDKKLLTSYNQIPELKGIRSVFQLRNRLIKDYIGWMTSEYKGYRILSKDVKAWFEHEIAPPGNDIYTPPELQRYAVSGEAYKKLLEEMEEKAKDVEQCSAEELWKGSILFYQQGKYDKALDLINVLVKREPENHLALYNRGHIAVKQMNKTVAIESFNEYSRMNPQSWWARMARDHVRRLQAG